MENSLREKLAELIYRMENTTQINKDSPYITGYRSALSELRVGIMELLNKEYGHPIGEDFYRLARHGKEKE